LLTCLRQRSNSAWPGNASGSEKEVCIPASHNPVLDETGKPFGVVKFAANVTAQKPKNVDRSGWFDAMSKSLAVSEFKLDGTRTSGNSSPRRQPPWRSKAP
jgi:hypothetical protein